MAGATNETKLWLSRLRNSAKILVLGLHLSRYPDLSARHDWLVKKAIVGLPIRMKGDTKCTSGNSLSPLDAQKKGLGAALQTLLGMVSIKFTSN